MLMHAAWTAVPGLRHGFLGRNDAPGPPWQVDVGGRRVAVAVPRQVHGTHVVPAAPDGERPEADGLVAAPGILVGVLTADCVPVLFVDRARRTAAAVHAGWRGAAAGVLEAGLAALGGRMADVEAAVGPAIGGCCYEVGPEVRDAFAAHTPDVTTTAWNRRGPRWHLDLREAVRHRLLAAGTGDVTVLGPCTRCGTGYHSYRRDGARAGRQISFVGWE